MTPYASVILPTLDRAATLPHALARVQDQTERALEIIVVLDGATAACRDIALAAARTDPRIVVRDLPKGPGGAHVNVHEAVLGARAERIFYTDDDDLLLPHHVRALGRLLDDADVADSRVCSVDRNGRLNLTPCPVANPVIRKLHAERTFKMLYDTHLAHRRSAYGGAASWFGVDPRRPVAAFIAGLAGDPRIRWLASEEVTALSLHGACRRDMDANARAREISSIAARPFSLAGADSLFHLFRLLWADPPQGATYEAYLHARGGYEARHGIELRLFSLVTKERLPEREAIELAMRLSEPVESGYLFDSVASVFLATYGQTDSEVIWEKACASEHPGAYATLAAILARRERQLARAAVERALAIGPDGLGMLAALRDQLD